MSAETKSNPPGAGGESGRVWHQWYEQHVGLDVEMPDMPLDRVLRQTARTFPKREAIHFMGRGVSYEELDESVTRMANGLISLGIQPGDRVALVLPNCPQFVIAYYGCLRAGAVACPANPTSAEGELQNQFEDSGARVVICLSLFYRTVASVRERLSGLEHVIVTSVKDYLPFLSRTYFAISRERREGHRVELPDDGHHHNWNDLLGSASADAPDIQVDVDSLAALQYTAGTTGTPKGVRLSHRNLLVGAEHARAWLVNVTSKEEQDSILGIVPLFHTYGQTTVMNYAILAGARSILQPRFAVKEVLSAVDQEKPGFLPGVPSMYRVLANANTSGQYDLSSLKACISGSAPLTERIQTRFEELSGSRLVEGYGLTEAPVTHCNPIQGERRIGSIGVPVPGTDAVIYDLETGTERLGPGEAGELAVRGPQVMQGYWNRPDETDEVLRDGWFFTGDVAEMDDDGFFRIVDRKKELIIVSGLNVFPSEVEHVALSHSDVSEAVAIGVPDEARGEAVKLFVILEEGGSVSERELIAYFRDRIAPYKIPRSVEFRDELPRNMIGKVLRRELREQDRKKQESDQ